MSISLHCPPLSVSVCVSLCLCLSICLSVSLCVCVCRGQRTISVITPQVSKPGDEPVSVLVAFMPVFCLSVCFCCCFFMWFWDQTQALTLTDKATSTPLFVMCVFSTQLSLLLLQTQKNQPDSGCNMKSLLSFLKAGKGECRRGGKHSSGAVSSVPVWRLSPDKMTLRSIIFASTRN